jgi:hypothetical protein
MKTRPGGAWLHSCAGKIFVLASGKIHVWQDYTVLVCAKYPIFNSPIL